MKKQIKQIISGKNDLILVLLENGKLYQGYISDGKLELEKVSIRIEKESEEL